MSGTRPTMKNRALMVRYVEIANTSHTRGDRKFGHRNRSFGYGISQYAYHMRPAWMTGKSPAVSTAKMVIASDPR
jgi:hypothetical protein